MKICNIYVTRSSCKKFERVWKSRLKTSEYYYAKFRRVHVCVCAFNSARNETPSQQGRFALIFFPLENVHRAFQGALGELWNVSLDMRRQIIIEAVASTSVYAVLTTSATGKLPPKIRPSWDETQISGHTSETCLEAWTQFQLR